MKRSLDAIELDVSGRLGRRAGSVPRMVSLALPLTLLCALLYVFGSWSPWLSSFTTLVGDHANWNFTSSTGVTSGTAASFTGLVALLHLSPAADRLAFGWYGWLDVMAMVWDVLPLCGIILAVALWLNGGASRTLRGAYAAWLLFASAVVGVGFYGTFAVLAGDYCPDDCTQIPIMVHDSPTWGIWLTLGVLLLAWIALVALARRPQSAHTDHPATARHAADAPARMRSRFALLGAGIFTLGAAIWAVGLLLVPWVTAGCTGVPISITHFVRGACSGLDGYDVLSAGLVNGPWDAFNSALSNMGLDPAHIVVLLIFAGVLLAVLVWRPGPARNHFRAVLALASVWALLVALELVMGWVGTTYRLGHQGILTFGSAPQVVGPGLWLSSVGIALAAVGIGAGWLGVRAQVGQHGSPPCSSRASARDAGLV